MRWNAVLVCSPTAVESSARPLPSGRRATASSSAAARSSDWMPPRSRVSAGAAGFARCLPLAFASATIAASLVVDRRGDHDEGEVDEAAIVNGVGGPGRNEDDVVLAQDRKGTRL